jgi:predicted Rossmann fold flavoprotein
MNREETTLDYDVIVIGGGASGMMAACIAARSGARVLLLEKNRRLGEKLRITGGGRCNITNVQPDTRSLLKHYGKAEKFLYSPFARFDIQNTLEFFSKLGVSIKIENRQRAFPVSDRAEDVVNALISDMRKHNVTVVTGSTVSSIVQSDDAISYLRSGGHRYSAKNYILASGGTSHPETGSTGDGFCWLAELGHKVREPSPSITPLAVSDPWVKRVSGLVLKNIRISVFVDERKQFRLDGDVLFTHFGMSGPLMLNNAYRVAELLKIGVVTATIDTAPNLETKQLDTLIASTLNEHGSKLLRNALPYFVPNGLSVVVRDLLKNSVDFDKKSSEVNKETRTLIVSVLKNIPFTVDGLMGLDKAVVADGGVDLSEIDTRTMRSRKINNLFITGDLLDINRPSGGFSLQLCWTTGFVAGTESATGRVQ